MSKPIKMSGAWPINCYRSFLAGPARRTNNTTPLYTVATFGLQTRLVKLPVVVDMIQGSHSVHCEVVALQVPQLSGESAAARLCVLRRRRAAFFTARILPGGLHFEKYFGLKILSVENPVTVGQFPIQCVYSRTYFLCKL